MSTKIRAKDINANFGLDGEGVGQAEEVGVGCLFPPQGKEKAEVSIKKLRELLEREYKMREWVFRQDSNRDIEEVLDELGGRNE